MLVAIDGSSVATGFALGGPKDGSPKGGVYTLPGAAEHVFDTTLARASRSVSELVRTVHAEWVFIEAPLLINDHQHAAHTSMALIQLTGALRSAATLAGARVRLAAVSTVRKHFIGQGNLKKAEAKAAVMERNRTLGWPYDFNGKPDDNRGDANALWAYGMSICYPTWSPRGTPLFADVRPA